jgi:uncharacterized membrane protein
MDVLAWIFGIEVLLGLTLGLANFITNIADRDENTNAVKIVIQGYKKCNILGYVLFSLLVLVLFPMALASLPLGLLGSLIAFIIEACTK